MRLKEIGVLFALAALFGSSFIFVRIASPVIGPYLTTQGRVSIGAILLIIIFIWLKKSILIKKRWKLFLMIGGLNSAIPFSLVSYAALELNASLLAIINSMTPLFTALVVWGWMKEKLSPKKMVGILSGMLGVLILVGWSPVPLTVEVVIAIFCSLFSTVSYSFGGVYAKKHFHELDSATVTFGQLIGASILLLPITILQFPETPIAVTPVVAYSLVGLSLLSTTSGYLLYYYLIKNVGPTATVSVTFIIPVFGMVAGALLLGEIITGGMIIGLMVILSSIFLISDIKMIKEKLVKEN